MLLGPSGAGKSTLLDVIIGLRPLADGRVELSGRDLAGVPIEQARHGLSASAARSVSPSHGAGEHRLWPPLPPPAPH